MSTATTATNTTYLFILINNLTQVRRKNNLKYIFLELPDVLTMNHISHSLPLFNPLLLHLGLVAYERETFNGRLLSFEGIVKEPIAGIRS